mmetsp:Transcript_5141/g.21931  ORF Transcript_5141/g.21931 Transcript_5141/m.21931 type:complete len:242 (-) Transcript_5141:283-1008(-)
MTSATFLPRRALLSSAAWLAWLLAIVALECFCSVAAIDGRVPNLLDRTGREVSSRLLDMQPDSAADAGPLPSPALHTTSACSTITSPLAPTSSPVTMPSSAGSTSWSRPSSTACSPPRARRNTRDRVAVAIMADRDSVSRMLNRRCSNGLWWTCSTTEGTRTSMAAATCDDASVTRLAANTSPILRSSTSASHQRSPGLYPSDMKRRLGRSTAPRNATKIDSGKPAPTNSSRATAPPTTDK